MNDFQIFEDLHTLAHLWARYKAYPLWGNGEAVTFSEYVLWEEPNRYTRLMRIFDFIKELDD